MNMKTSTCLALIILSSGCANAQTERQWKMTLKVLDDTGTPVADASAGVSYSVLPPPDIRYATERIEGRTDTNGFFTASHLSSEGSAMGFGVEKVGYYGVHVPYDLPDQYDPAKWELTTNLVLKRMNRPLAMYAKRVNLGMPEFEKLIGFDLMAGDWVAPYGKGLNRDLLFAGHFDKRPDGESRYKLVVSFPNAGDGIQDFVADRSNGGSDLRSSQEAPASGYQAQWVQFDNRKPGEVVETNRDKSRNYYFRVRTVLDEQGNVKSALYGKIYGDFMQFSYYLNPTPNDRGVEFNPGRNLLSHIESFERPIAP